ncbi:MAG: hypothetical protein ABEJ03_05980 [Candidatus Nanohaloarchaea archaeon]
MLDLKVMGAVLASLAVLGSVSNGTAEPLSLGNLKFDGLSDLELTPRSVGAFAGLVNREAPSTDVSARLDINGSLPQDIETENATLTVKDLRTLESGTGRIESDEEISLTGFSGTVSVDEQIRVKGTASGAVTSGVAVSQDFRLDTAFNRSAFELSDASISGIEMESVTGSIESSSTSATIGEDSSLEIDSLRGSLAIDRDSRSMNLSGKVSGLSAGSVSLG